MSDVATLIPLYTDVRTQQFVGQLLSDEAAQHRLQACCEANSRPAATQFYLAIEGRNGQLAGLAAVFDIRATEAALELGIMLLPGAQSPGLAKSAYAALIQSAFSAGFKAVYATMAPQNYAALRLVRQCAMQPDSATADAVRYCIRR